MNFSLFNTKDIKAKSYDIRSNIDISFDEAIFKIFYEKEKNDEIVGTSLVSDDYENLIKKRELDEKEFNKLVIKEIKNETVDDLELNSYTECETDTENESEIKSQKKIMCKNRVEKSLKQEVFWSDDKQDEKKIDKCLVKIDDEFKYISKTILSVGDIKKLIKFFYPNKEINLFTLPNNSDQIIKTLINESEFLNNNDININELIENINNYNKFIMYIKSIDPANPLINNKNDLEPILKKEINSNSNSFLFESKNLFPKENEFDPNINLGTRQLDNKKIFELFNDQKENYEKAIDITGYMYLDDFNKPFLSTNTNNIENTCDIYYNSQFNNLFMISITDKLNLLNVVNLFEENKQIFPELQLICSINYQYEDQINQISKLINNVFVDYNDAKEIITKITEEKKVNSKLSINEIKDLINKYFSIDDNPKNCVKFTSLFNTIFSEIQITEHFNKYMKRQLPLILTDLNLKKKRLADGIYWYGLKAKSQDEIFKHKPSQNNNNNNNKIQNIQCFTRLDGKRIVINTNPTPKLLNKTFNEMFSDTVYNDLKYGYQVS